MGFAVALILGAISTNKRASHVCGPVSGTFDVAGSPYRVTCDLVVGPEATLVIDPGVELRFATDTGLVVDGRLRVDGTSVSPVLLTADTESPMAGDWGKVTINGSASMDWTIVSYGSGVVVTGRFDVADSVFELNGGSTDPPAVSFGAGTTGSITNTLFDRNSIPLFLVTNADPQLADLKVKLNHLFNGIEVDGGPWTISRVWTDAGVPYAFNSPPTFGPGTVQTLEPGVVFKLFASDDLIFDRLTILGTEDQPVIFTSLWDDTAGGDTFPGSTARPAPGDWGELRILGRSNLDHLEVRFGSGSITSSEELEARDVVGLFYRELAGRVLRGHPPLLS